MGRSYRDAPEIDGYVMIEGQAPVGEIVPVRITGALTYDLIGAVDVAPPLTIIGPEGIALPGDSKG
ncbi:MAG: hypothetical protein HC915_15185 [Anaerolineae bacterium]|nr:hypothetical protein [Anaerolineae bacterium]